MADAQPTTGELLQDLSQQITTLVRQEIELAKAEVIVKGKRTGRGAGMLGGAALVGLLGTGALTAAAIAGLATLIPVWAAALIVGTVLLAAAAVVGLRGKKKIEQATPPATHGRGREHEGGPQVAEDPDSIRQAIEETREELAETVQAMGRKADLKARVAAKADDAVVAANGAASGLAAKMPEPLRPAADTASSQVQAAVHGLRRNPKPAAIAAAALLLLMMVRRRRRRSWQNLAG